MPLTARDWGTDSRSVIPTRGALGRGWGGVVGWSGGRVAGGEKSGGMRDGLGSFTKPFVVVIDCLT